RYLPEYTRAPAVFNEGYLSVAVPPYPIPYRALTPKREDADDLLVPVCLSASHVAFGSVRMEPTFMLLGHAAGVAEAQAARRGVATIDVWGAHLIPDWATDAHVDAAVDALDRRGLRVATYATWIDPTNVERACELTLALGASVIGGGFSGEPEEIAPLLAKYG